MTAKNIIDLIALGDTVSIKEAIEASIQAKVAERLENMRFDLIDATFNEGLDPVGDEDDDVDNDGDEDESDDYLKNRRKKISSKIKNDDDDDDDDEDEELDEEYATFAYLSDSEINELKVPGKIKQAIYKKKYGVSPKVAAKQAKDTVTKEKKAGGGNIQRLGPNDKPSKPGSPEGMKNRQRLKRSTSGGVDHRRSQSDTIGPGQSDFYIKDVPGKTGKDAHPKGYTRDPNVKRKTNEETQIDELFGNKAKKKEQQKSQELRSMLDGIKRSSQIDARELYKKRMAELAAKRAAAAKNEDFQIDELSKKTLGSYVNKAAKSAVTRASIWHTDPTSTATTSNRRLKNIAKATSRLTKEDSQIDEAGNPRRTVADKTSAFVARQKQKAHRENFRKADSNKIYPSVTPKGGSQGAERTTSEGVEEGYYSSKPGANRKQQIIDTRRRRERLAALNKSSTIQHQQALANKKKVSEDSQIDELSNKTLGSYIRKATGREEEERTRGLNKATARIIKNRKGPQDQPGATGRWPVSSTPVPNWRTPMPDS